MATAVRPSRHQDTAFRIDVHPERECVRVAALGEVDLATVSMLQAQLGELRDTGFDAIVLDLREVSFLDSSGVAAIVAEDRLARSNGHSFMLIAGPPAVQRVLDICGLLERLRFRVA